MNRKGFTLVELMVIVIIVGVLAALAIPKFIEAKKRANGEQVDSSSTVTIPLFQSIVIHRDTVPNVVTPDQRPKPETHCIEGYKFIVSPNGNSQQLLNGEGHGVRCFETKE